LDALSESNYSNSQHYDKNSNDQKPSLNETYFSGKAFVYSGFSKQLAYLKVHQDKPSTQPSIFKSKLSENRD
jgi:hypothetical protein